VPELPHSLASKPELYLHLTLVWIIFMLVKSCRIMTDSGVGSIALADIRAMLDEFEIEETDVRIYYIQIIQAVDQVYVQHLARLRK